MCTWKTLTPAVKPKPRPPKRACAQDQMLFPLSTSLETGLHITPIPVCCLSVHDVTPTFKSYPPPTHGGLF
jgi:hypothetical protein